MILRFTIGASGRQGSRTLISIGRTALAGRPGQPYPATFRSGPTGNRTRISDHFLHRPPADAPDVFPLDYEPIAVDRRGVEPRFPGCKPGVFPLDQQPISLKSPPVT